MPYAFSNILDYVRDQDVSFSRRGLCRVDSLVFSWLSYLRFPDEMTGVYARRGMRLREVCDARYSQALVGRLFDPARSWELLELCAHSRRFADVVAHDYFFITDERSEQQFAAVTFTLPTSGHFCAFRGTDNTLVGWKEDFNMAFASEVPAQRTAVAYLEDIGKAHAGPLWCGGHSKGGNLAVYATIMSSPEVSSRVRRCFSHDGPGFSDAVLSDTRWKRATEVVDKTVPQSSFVGMVFEGQESSYTVVHSNAIGFLQHDPFSWEVAGTDFVVVERVGMSAERLGLSVNSWLQSTTAQERERFVDAVFKVLGASGLKTIADIKAHWKQSVPRMLLAASALDSDQRTVVLDAIREIGRRLVGDATDTRVYKQLLLNVVDISLARAKASLPPTGDDR